MKLKPCPFCGSNPILVERKRFEAKHGIGCSNVFCFLYLPEGIPKAELHNYVYMYVDKERMIHDWNHRNPEESCMKFIKTKIQIYWLAIKYFVHGGSWKSAKIYASLIVKGFR